jgi:hypothetical protein
MPSKRNVFLAYDGQAGAGRFHSALRPQLASLDSIVTESIRIYCTLSSTLLFAYLSNKNSRLSPALHLPGPGRRTAGFQIICSPVCASCDSTVRSESHKQELLPGTSTGSRTRTYKWGTYGRTVPTVAPYRYLM